MFINVHSISSPTPTSRVPNAAFWVTLHRDKVHDEEAADINPPHNIGCMYPLHIQSPMQSSNATQIMIEIGQIYDIYYIR